jgi:hypothetical protein
MPQGLQAAPDHHDAAGDAHPVPELGQRGLRILADESPEPLQLGGIERRRPTTTVRSGSGRTGKTPFLQQPGDGRDVDGEPPGEFASRAFLVVHGIKDALPEVVGQGPHDQTPFGVRSYNPCANRP